MFKNCYSTPPIITIINRDEFLEKYFANFKFNLESTKFGGYLPIHFKNNMRYVEVYKCTDTEYKAIEYNELVDILNEFMDRQFIILAPCDTTINIHFILGKK
jgi:hypothetical protein